MYVCLGLLIHHHVSSFEHYWGQGFIDAQQFDVLLIVGDFNVDFDRQGQHIPLLLAFMAENNLVASYLFYRSTVSFTYERDDGAC